MAAAAVPVSLLDGLLNRLETYVKAGTSAQFLKLTGDLVSDASPEALSKAVWSGSDPPGPAALGGLRCLLGKPEISAVADWANVIPTGGGQGFLNQEARWFEVHGFGLATKIAQTALISTGAPGGGQVTAAMADGRELMYLDIVMATTHANFPTFQNFVEQGSFAEANAMLSARTEWAALMARGVTYGASTMTSKVHASEAKRRLFNQVVAGYYKLEGKLMAETVNASLPTERQMLAAAIVAAADHLRALHCSTHGDMQKAWRHAAAGFRQATPAQVPLWNAHECQAAITSCLMAFDLIIGTTMTGIGMTQRAATLIQEWAIVDPDFTAWSREFGTPRGEKGPWHFIETIILTPMFKWMSTAWGYLRGQNAAPPPMASIFDEQQATPRKDHANMQALLVKLQRIKQHADSGTKRERADKNSMETQPADKPNHTRRTTTAPARNGNGNGNRNGNSPGGANNRSPRGKKRSSPGHLHRANTRPSGPGPAGQNRHGSSPQGNLRPPAGRTGAPRGGAVSG